MFTSAAKQGLVAFSIGLFMILVTFLGIYILPSDFLTGVRTISLEFGTLLVFLGGKRLIDSFTKTRLDNQKNKHPKILSSPQGRILENQQKLKTELQKYHRLFFANFMINMLSLPWYGYYLIFLVQRTPESALIPTLSMMGGLLIFISGIIAQHFRRDYYFLKAGRRYIKEAEKACSKSELSSGILSYLRMLSLYLAERWNMPSADQTPCSIEELKAGVSFNTFSTVWSGVALVLFIPLLLFNLASTPEFLFGQYLVLILWLILTILASLVISFGLLRLQWRWVQALIMSERWAIALEHEIGSTLELEEG